MSNPSIINNDCTSIFSERHHQSGAGSFASIVRAWLRVELRPWVRDWQGCPAGTKRGTHDGKYTCAHDFSVIFPVS